ncbi:ATP-binding protein [Parafrankia sp. FMc2]|uniref:sensor histidine kinase n=1 Tax=Parafrankia sp. FMc2 TaxID=3233196 RepID=UPI0034D71BBD
MTGTNGFVDCRLRRPRVHGNLALQIFGLQVLVIVVVAVASVAAAYVQAQRATLGAATERTVSIAQSVAASPAVLAALHDAAPSRLLAPYAEDVRFRTGTDFVVVMNVDRIRYSHPNTDEVGRRFLGHVEPALAGGVLTETYTGTLGPSVRAVVPVFDIGGDDAGSAGGSGAMASSSAASGKVLGLVSVGVTRSVVSRELHRELPALGLAGVAALGLAAVGTGLVSSRLHRQTHGLGPVELNRMYVYYDAVLHAVREGLLLLDRAGRLALVNDEARRLLRLGESAPATTVRLPSPLTEVLAEGRERTDEIHPVGDRILVVNQARACWAGEDLGTVVTLRDHTDLQALTDEVDSVRGFAEALRSQAHEAANRLHVVVSLIELGRPRQALEFATEELALSQKLTDRIAASLAEPVLAALLLGKAAQASERGVELIIADDIEVPEGLFEPRDLVTIVGNLIDNALDAALDAPAPRWVRVQARLVDASLELHLADSGSGLAPEDAAAAFRRGWSTKSDERLVGRGLGLALVGQTVHRHGGQIEVTHEQGAGFTVRLPVPATGPSAASPPTSAAASPAATATVITEVVVSPGVRGPLGPYPDTGWESKL